MPKKKSNRNVENEEGANESWLLPYSDMMTLLLALFVVMFAMSSINEAKFNSVMESLYTAFGGTTDVGSPTPLPYPDAGLPSQSSIQEMLEANASPDGKGLSNLYLSLNEYTQANGLDDSISVEYQGDKVLITLKDDVFFESGSAELSQDMLDEAQSIAQLLYDNEDHANPFDVVVAGHTDNVPISTPQYPSNWYLSQQRAVNFLAAILNGSELDPTHFSTRGYGEYVPVATNDTDEGRQKNRRVELLISEDTGQALETGSTVVDTSTPAASVSGIESEAVSIAPAAGNTAPEGGSTVSETGNSTS